MINTNPFFDFYLSASSSESGPSGRVVVVSLCGGERLRNVDAEFGNIGRRQYRRIGENVGKVTSPWSLLYMLVVLVV